MKRVTAVALTLLLTLALCSPAWAVGPAESDVFYEQMDEFVKALYDAERTAEILQCYRSGERFSFTFDGPFPDFDQASTAILDASSCVVAALLLNYPELFWLKGSDDRARGNTEKITLTVTPFFAYNWAHGERSVQEDSATVDAAVQQLAAEAKAQGGKYEQLLYVHDWLTAHNAYNAAAASVGGALDYLPWTPLAALTDVSQPVCEGYAKAFKLACDALEIPCLLVDGDAGSGHMWNQVLLNGRWYAVDVTWDDPVVSGDSGWISGGGIHDYFLVGADTVIDGETFSDSHVPRGMRIEGISFSYPTLSDSAFDPSAPEPIVFADVSDTAYYAPAVSWAVARNVTNGTRRNDENGQNWFSPDATVKRSEAVTFLYRAMWEPEPETKTNRFSDVPAGSYYEKAVLWAVENGITNGTTWDEEHGVYEFSPDAPVTRGQLLTFLWRTVGRPGDTGGGVWYADAERWAAEFGIAEGTAEPYTTGGDCPRSDVVYYLYQSIRSMAG